ncbi:MAG TPA: MXAN_5187 C-terminal domain-containing protein, partial [Kofleriaceae bacterium]|nr:MXAN_5187 C-terminal domain-containing protein [Kofleriaceae bacterium]
MFWSKIWFFLIALVGAVAVTVALVLPRPAQRALVGVEANRLETACSVIHILLADDARNRVELAGAFARSPEIMNALEAASGAEHLDEARMKQVRDVGDSVMKAIQGNRKPDFAMLIDKRGRVVARVRLNDNDFGDVAAGRPLIDDALAGYLRDDLWAQNGTMYFVSAAPVVKQGGYVGAVVLGHQVTNQLAETLVKSLEVDMGFHLAADGVAGSRTIAFDHGPMLAALGKLGDDPTADCQHVQPMEVHAGADRYTALVARLPGEAAAKQAFYSVLIKRPEGVGFAGSLKEIKESDLAFGNFPWIPVGGGFLVVLALGIGLMFLEADRPLRRLTTDAVRLAKGELERMTEDAHGGKHGSIARSVNIHVDKLGREAKAAKKDLDQLLGPAPDSGLGSLGGLGGLGGLGTIDLLAGGPPRAAAPSAVQPPPAEFRFQDAAPPPSELRLADSGPVAARKPPVRPGTPPPVRTQAPPPPPMARRPSAQYAAPPPPPPHTNPGFPPPPFPAPPHMLDDDFLGRSGAGDSMTMIGDPYFRHIFDQFVATKQSCGESIAGLVFERFAEKLIKNRDDLM